MLKIITRSRLFIANLTGKIGFYPSLFALGGLVFGFAMLYAEDRGVSSFLIENAPQLVINDAETARTLLSTFIGGIISLMVFSFSMVMILLNQASNNYSPRLLPGLISDKHHQVILGIYLATILYNIFILFSVEPSEDKYTLPGFSVLLGIVFTILCLVAFIYFIHNISQSIQINNILDTIFENAERRLKKLIESEEGQTKEFPQTSNWHEYKAGRSGYFQNISIKNILRICDEKETKIYITIPKGLFVLNNAVFLKSEKELDDNVVDSIISNISFARGELVEDNYVLAFKQITEIAVKAMSPGINDPGTAINAIDYLTDLFALRMQKNDNGIIIHEENAILKVAVVTFKELMYNVMASLRTYCKHDPVMVEKLLWMLVYLQKQPAAEDNYITVIKGEMKTLLGQAKNSFDSEWDVSMIDKMIAG